MNELGKSKILLLVEGEKVEKELFEHFYSLYGFENVEIIAYKSNVYAFYHRLKKDFSTKEGKIEYDFIDLPLFLNDYLNLDGERLLNEYDYQDRILIFDFDPQDPSYSAEKLQELMANFTDSTERGKLYLNYPMVESFQDISSLEDCNFESSTVHFDIVKNKRGKVSEYKKVVDSKTCIPKISDIDKDIGNRLFEIHKKKVHAIIGADLEIETKYFRLCEIQCDKLNEESLIWVVNTSILHLFDEYGKMK